MNDQNLKKKPVKIIGKDLKIFLIFFILILSGFMYVYTDDTQITNSQIANFDNQVISSGLPIIVITTDEAIKPYTYTRSLVHMYDNGSDPAPKIFNAKIRHRGQISLYFPKKSYNIELFNTYSLLGLKSNDKWDLFSGFLDFTKLRIKLSMDVWRSIQHQETTLPESRYTLVYVNEDLQGLYLLAENFDQDLLNFKVSNNLLDTDYIIEARSGGNFSYPYSFWEQHFPDVDVINMVDWVIPQLEAFISNATDAQFFDETTGIYSLFNRENLINFFLFNNFIGHTDFWTKNYFIVRGQVTNKASLVPWDFDGSFGQYSWFLYNASEAIRGQENYLFARLMKHPEFIQSYTTRWNELRQTLWTNDYIFTLLNTNLQQILPILALEAELWDPNDQLKQSTASDYNITQVTIPGYIDKLQNYIEARLLFLDNLWLIDAK